MSHESLFQNFDAFSRDQMDSHYWTEIGQAFVQLYPKKSLIIADKILEHFGETGTILESFYSRENNILNGITRRYPKEVWMRITKYLGPPIDSRAFYITQWLRGRDLFGEEKEGGLSLIPLEDVWNWIDGDVEKRAWYLASFVPKMLFHQEQRVCLAREVLVRYGEREDVRRNLIANFSTEGYSGPASLHYREKRQKLLDFRKEEKDEKVKSWIDKYVSYLESEIKRTRMEEEREGF